MWATLQLHLRAIDNSVVNPPEELLSDGATCQQGLGPLTQKAVAFICNFTCAVTAMIFPHFHHFHVMCTCNLMITSVLRTHTFADGQEDDFSLHYVLHISVTNLEACSLSLALLTEQVGQTCVLWTDHKWNSDRSYL